MSRYAIRALVLVVLAAFVACAPVAPTPPGDIPDDDPNPSPVPPISAAPEIRAPRPTDSIAVISSRSIVPTGVLDPCQSPVRMSFVAPLVNDPGPNGPVQNRVDGSLVEYRIAEVRRPDGTLVFDFADPPAGVNPAGFGTLAVVCDDGSVRPQGLRNLGNHVFEAEYYPPDFVPEPLQVVIAFFGRAAAPAPAPAARLVGDDEFLLGTSVIELRPPDRPLSVNLTVAPNESIVVPGDATKPGTVNATPSTRLTAFLEGGTPNVDDPDGLYRITWLVNDNPILPATVVPGPVEAVDSDGDGVDDRFTSTLDVTAGLSLIGAPLFRAVVEDARGSTASAVLAVTVAAPLNIVLNSNPARPRGGDIVVVSASASGGLPPYRYIWSNTLGIGFINQEPGEETDATSVALRLPDDTERFDVVVEIIDQRGNRIRHSLAEQSGEDDGVGTRCNLGDEPTVIAQPADVGVGAGPATFSVTARAGIDGGLFAITWERNTGIGFQIVRAGTDSDIAIPSPAVVINPEATTRTVTATLIINNVRPQDQVEPALYRAIITNDCGSATSDAARLDRTGPTTTVTLDPATPGPVNSAGTVNVLVAFSEDVTGFASGDVVLNHTGTAGGTVGAVTVVDARNYIVPISDVAGDGSFTVTVPAGAALDGAGNSNEAGTGPAIQVDNTAPTVASITSTTPDGTYNAGSGINVTVTFSEPVVLADGTLKVTLNTGGEVSFAPFGPADSAIGTYVVRPGDATPQLDVDDIALDGGATLSDAAGNAALVALPDETIADGSAIVIDTTVASVASVTSTTADGTYGAGSNINVTVTFSAPVTLQGGTLDVRLNTGGGGRVVSIAPFGPATTAVGVYTVGAGDTASPLDVLGLSLSAGTLRDGGGNTVPLTLPAATIGTTSTIIIDTQTPSIVSITSTTADGTYGVGSDINVTVTFSEAVTLAGGTLDVRLNTGGAGTLISIQPFSQAQTAAATYIVAAGHNSADLDATAITLSGGTLRDGAGNAVPVALPAVTIATGSSIVVDTTQSDIASISSTTPNGAYGAGELINVTVTFQKPVSLVGGTLDVTLDTGAVVSIAEFGPAMSASGTYSVQPGDDSLDLDAVDIDLSGGTLRDQADNNVNVALPGSTIADTSAIVIDTTAPEILSITSSTPNGTYNAGTAINVTINFSEPVTLSGGTLDVTLDTGAVVSVLPFVLQPVGLTTYIVSPGHNSPDLDSTDIALGAGTLRDAAGNDAVVALPAGNTIADLKAIIINTSAPGIQNVEVPAERTVDVTFTTEMKEPGVSTAANYTVSGTGKGTLANNPDSVTDQGGNVYRLEWLAPDEMRNGGDITITVSAVVTDSAGNPLNNPNVFTTLGAGLGTAPTILSGNLAASNAHVDVIMSEGVFTNSNGTGALVAGDFGLVFAQNGGNATNVTIASVTTTAGGALAGGETDIRVNLTVTGTPSGDETVTITPAGANAIFDAAGNPMAAGQTTGALTLNDQLPPTIDNGAVAADNAHVDVTMSEAVFANNDGTGALVPADFTLVFAQNGGSATAATIDSLTDDNGDPLAGGETVIRVVLDITGLPDGNETVTITPAGANTIFDAVGNAMAAGQTTGALALNDQSPATIDNGAVAADNAHVDVTMNEGVFANNDGTGALVPADFTLVFAQNGGNATAATIDSLTDDNGDPLAGGETVIRVVLDITGLPDGNETVTITPANGNSIFDAGGNPMAAGQTTGALVLNDQLPPTIDNGAVAADNAHVDVTISEGAFANNDGSGALVPADFTLVFAQNGGNATAATIDSLTDDNGDPLAGGETVIRVVLDITGVPDGNETVTITPADGNSIFDAAGNPMGAGQTTGDLALNDQLPPTIDGGVVEAGNAHVDVTISEGVFANNDGTGALVVADLNLVFAQNGGTATDATIDSLTDDNGDPLVGGETVIRVVLNITGVPDGNETVTITPVDGNSIFDAAGNAMAAGQTTGALNLNP